MAATVVTGRRADAMAARIRDTAERLGVHSAGRALIAAALDAAMAPRARAGLDDHHPDYLHPARTALILMDDAAVADARILAAAVITETRDPALRPDPADVARLPEPVRAVTAAVPDPAEPERVLERLVIADPAARIVAVAERLDHARHLHLREPDEWAGYHDLTCTAYAPAAARAHPVLDRRLAWWCRTFGKRFLGAV